MKARAFSGSCISLDQTDTVHCSTLVSRKHLLGSGVDYFTAEGRPLKPKPGAAELQRAFSGSALDLNAMRDSVGDEDPCIHSPCWSAGGVANGFSPTSEREDGDWKCKDTVAVIGDNTYVAINVVSKLLSVGYTVHVIVSDPSKLYPYNNLQQIYGYDISQQLFVFQKCIWDELALASGLKGCKYIIHCGCTYYATENGGTTTVFPPQSPTFGAKHPQDIAAYHRKAAKSLFGAIRHIGSTSVKRVIITGTHTSIYHYSDPLPSSGMFDETHWDEKTKEKEDPLAFAKREFEREIHESAKKVGVECIVLLPSVIIGVSQVEENSPAISCIKDLILAKFPFCPDLDFNFVSLEDVAECHIRALECPDALNGRIIISCENINLPQLSILIKKSHPNLHPPTWICPHILTIALMSFSTPLAGLKRKWRCLGVKFPLDNSLAKSKLNMNFSLESSVKECVEKILSVEKEITDSSSSTWSVYAAAGTALSIALTGFFVWRMKR